MIGVVRAVVWIVEGTWEATVDAAASLLPADADVELLHVAFDAETFVRGARRGLLGRHPQPAGGPDFTTPCPSASEEEAAGLLADAARGWAAAATTTARRGRAEDEVLDGASATPTSWSSPAAASPAIWDPRASDTRSASSSTTRRARSYWCASAPASASRSLTPSLR